MFSKSCEYALRSVLYLSLYSDETRKLGVSTLAEQLMVPRHFLAKVLQQLAKNNLISSTKGPNGGFFMVEENQATNLLHVIECIDGPNVFRSCILGLPECSDRNPCTLHERMTDCRNKMLESLQNETIRESAKRIANNNFKI